MELGFFSLPMSAGPRDAVVGQDELGRPVRQTVLGQQYGFQAPAPSVPYAQQLAAVGQPDNRAQGMRLGDTVVANPDREGLGGADALAAVRGLIDGATQGITAPARAARGEPVTYGDVAATAVDWGLMGAPMAAPEGALRAGSFRGYHGSPNKNIERFRTRSSSGRFSEPAFFAVDEPGTDAIGYANSYNYNPRTGQDMAGRTYTADFAANPNILDARIPAERQALIDALNASDRIGEGGETFLLNQSQRGSQLPGWGDSRLYDVLDDAGYDGVLLQERPTDPGGGGGVVSAAIFNPDVINLVDEAAQPSFRAYHGSPHDFDRFSLDHIGTGEGAQAYGSGLYFSQSEDVARSYRDALTVNPPGSQAEGEVWSALRYSSSPEKARADLQWRLQDSQATGDTWGARTLQEAIDNFDEIAARRPGRMYEVQINADPEAFLNWDAPLSQHPEAVRGLMQEEYDWRRSRRMPLDTSNSMNGRLDQGTLTGEDVAKWWGGDTSPLRDAGIPGIRYLDGNSRGTGAGTSNYVVFDDSIIEIIRKYGVAGAAPMLGLTAQQLQNEMDAQGIEG